VATCHNCIITRQEEINNNGHDDTKATTHPQPAAKPAHKTAPELKVEDIPIDMNNTPNPEAAAEIEAISQGHMAEVVRTRRTAPMRKVITPRCVELSLSHPHASQGLRRSEGAVADRAAQSAKLGQGDRPEGRRPVRGP